MKRVVISVSMTMLALAYVVQGADRGTAVSVSSAPPVVVAAPLASNVQKMVIVDFQCVDMTNVIRWLAEVSGDTIIADPSVSGPVTIVNPQPAPVARAQQIIYSVLEMRGFTVVRQGNIVKIVPAASAARRPIPTVKPQPPKTKEQ